MKTPKPQQEIFKKPLKQELQIKALEKENEELKLLLKQKNEPLTRVQKTIKDHIVYCLREYSQFPPEDIKIGYEEIKKLEKLIKLKKIIF